MRTKEENRPFEIDKKPENLGQQKRGKMREKPILDSMTD